MNSVREALLSLILKLEESFNCPGRDTNHFVVLNSTSERKGFRLMIRFNLSQIKSFFSRMRLVSFVEITNDQISNKQTEELTQ